jgi:hypothetical protein
LTLGKREFVRKVVELDLNFIPTPKSRLKPQQINCGEEKREEKQCCQVLAREISQMRFERSHFLATFSAQKEESDCRFYDILNGTLNFKNWLRKQNKDQAAVE